MSSVYTCTCTSTCSEPGIQIHDEVVPKKENLPARELWESLLISSEREDQDMLVDWAETAASSRHLLNMGS